MSEVWVDYSGYRPDPHYVKRAGVRGVLRYLSEPDPATAWKRITKGEKDAILAAGLDLILNWEWYEGRMLEGAPAGAHDGAEALRQARALGYPKGATIFFSHDTSARDDAAVLAYMRAAQHALGDEYKADIYSGYDTVELAMRHGVAGYGWQTLAWSYGRMSSAHIYQNGNGNWFGGEADGDIIRAHPLGSWNDHAVAGTGHSVDTSTSRPITPAPSPRPSPTPSGQYLVVSGDTLAGIAVKSNTTVAQLLAWNPAIKNPNVIQVGWVLKVSGSKSEPPKVEPPKVEPKPTPTHLYKVQKGDNLTRIALTYHTTVNELLRLNPGLKGHPHLLKPGLAVRVPGAAKPVHKAPVKRYRIVSGDTLAHIAAHFDTTVHQLLAWNPVIKNPNVIHAGWVIRVA